MDKLTNQLEHNGYKRSEGFTQNTIPGVIASRVFSVSDSKLKEFYQYLCKVYESDTAKPILEVIAAQIISKDDLIITYGFECGANINGYYVSDISLIDEYMATLSPIEQEVISTVFKLQSIGRDLNYFYNQKHISIAIPHPKEDKKTVENTIVHEFSHMASDIIFKNNCLGYQGSNEDAAINLMNANNELSKKLLFVLMPELSDIYDSIDHFTVNKIIEKLYTYKDENQLEKDERYEKLIEQVKKIGINDLMNTVTVPSCYGSKYLVQTENFARLLEGLYFVNSYPKLSPMFKCFKPYIDNHLNPALTEFFKQNAVYLEKFSDIKKNIDAEVQDFDTSEALYFSVVFRDDEALAKLISEKVDVNSPCFGLIRPLTAAVLSNNEKAIKMLMNQDEIELDYYDIKCLKNDIKTQVKSSFPEFETYFNQEIVMQDQGIFHYEHMPELIEQEFLMC
ncbi:MAG: hypothetical protein ACK5WS_01320 [Alphaproteobacteria bacterium]|jgi:hypothetical protein|nr:hypothetical protein [Candidatus Jidaibacter sp.]